MSDQEERFDDVKQLLQRGAAGAPADDLTWVAWAGGRRRARVRAWSVGSVGAAASVAAVVAAWSLGGGQASPPPSPADDASSTSDPTAQGPRYRITYDVVEGKALPDGDVQSWDQLAGTRLEPVEFTVTTEHGVSSAEYPGPLGLGGPIEFRTDHEVVISDGCRLFTYTDVQIRDSQLVPGRAWPRGEPVADCERSDPTQPNEVLMVPGEDAVRRGSGNLPRLAWSKGQLVASGTVDPQIVAPHVSFPKDAGADGPTALTFARVPQTDLEDVYLFSNDRRPAEGTEQSVIGPWYLVDQRGLQPYNGGPELHFNGDEWTVIVCSMELTVPGDVQDGRIVVHEPWTVTEREHEFGPDEVPTEQECPNMPWQNPEAWESLLEASPTASFQPKAHDHPEALILTRDPNAP
jgi:hypothetical protein